MADSLILAEQIELLGGGVASTIPECAGAVFRLAPGFTLSAPDPQSNVVASLILDGERPVGRRAGNRAPAIPVVIRAPDRATLAAAREVLIRAVDADYFTLKWTRDTALPLVLDCFRAAATVVDYSILRDRELISTLTLSFQALPYGRSDTPVIAEFPSPLTGKTAAPSPLTIDGYTTVSGTHWSQSVQGPGAFSAFWTTGSSGLGVTASYTASGLGPLNLTGYNGLAVYAGFGSTGFFPWFGLRMAGPVQFTFKLTDGTHSASVHVTRRVRMSSNSFAPVWQRIRVPIPAGSGLNLAAVTGYTITVSSRQSGDLPYTELYLSSFAAVPYATAASVQPVSGTVIDLGGIAGSARSPFSLQIQQPPGVSSSNQKVYSTPGDFLFLAPSGCTAIQRAEAYAAGGKGSADTGATYRGGAGGGEYQGEPGIPVTPGNTYPVHVPGQSANLTGTGDSASFTGDGGAGILAHGGTNQPDNTTAGSAGGTGASRIVRLTGQNNNFDGGIGTWAAGSNATVAPTSAQHQAGTGALAVTSVAAGDMYAGSCPSASILTQGIPCDPLWPVVVNGFSKAATTARNTAGGAEFYDANGNSLGQLFGTQIANVTTSWTALNQATLTPPAGAVWCRAISKTFATGAASETHWTDTMTLFSGVHNNGGAGGNGANPAGGGGGGAGGPGGVGTAGQAGNLGGAGGGGNGGLAGAGGLGGQSTGMAGVTGSQAGGGGGGAQGGLSRTKGGLGQSGAVALTYFQTLGAKTLVIHRPGFDAPDTLSPFVMLSSGDIPNGSTEYVVPSLVAETPARFGSTYTVMLVSFSWSNPSASRTLTVTVKHYEQLGGLVYTQQISRTLTPNALASQLVNLGEVTIPDHLLPDDNVNGYFTITVTDSNTADRFQDCLFLDTLGSTIVIESTNAYVNYFIDEPPTDRSLGNIMGSMFDRGDAISVLAYASVSGPPMTVDPLGNQTLLIYCADQSAPSAELVHYPRWMVDRLS